MSISSLFSGMEAYLDGDVEINNNVGVPDDAAADAEVAEQTAEVASDTADATEEAKDTEVASQMLSRMCDMYDHVKQFGIDRTFVSLYNRHGELDRVCGIQFPSCESMDVVGDRYSRYSTAFIAAMESSGSGLWAKIKAFIAKIWNWIKNIASKIWEKIKSIFGFGRNRIKKITNIIRNNKGKLIIGASATAAVVAGLAWLKRSNQKKINTDKIQQYTDELKKATDKIAQLENDSQQQSKVLSEARQKVVDLESEVNLLYSELATARKEASAAKQELDNKTRQLAEREKELNERNKQLDQNKTELDRKDRELKRANQRVEDLKKWRDNRDAEIEARVKQEQEAEKRAKELKEKAEQQKMQEERTQRQRDAAYGRITSGKYNPTAFQIGGDMELAQNLAEFDGILDRWFNKNNHCALGLRLGLQQVLATIDKLAKIYKGNQNTKLGNELLSELLKASTKMQAALDIINNEGSRGNMVTNEVIQRINAQLNSIKNKNRIKVLGLHLIENTEDYSTITN